MNKFTYKSEMLSGKKKEFEMPSTITDHICYIRVESKKRGALSAHLTRALGYLVRASLSTPICQTQMGTVNMSIRNELQGYLLYRGLQLEYILSVLR